MTSDHPNVASQTTRTPAGSLAITSGRGRRKTSITEPGQEGAAIAEHVVPAGPGTTWSSEQCAQAWEVKVTTWLGYVSRGQAPPPLAEPGDDGRRRWSAAEVHRFPRPGVGRTRAGATPEAAELLDGMRDVAAQLAELRTRQRELLVAGRDQGLEVLAMARALGISRQTAAGWLRET